MFGSRRASSALRLLTWFALSVVAVLGVAGALSVLLPEVAAEDVATASIVLGLAWMLVGWFLTPSVETYVGQGAVEGVPIIGPTFANPQRNPAVLADLTDRLSRQTDLGLVSAALGFGLMVVGFSFYVTPAAGFGAGLVCLAVVLAVLWRSSRSLRPRAPA